jgi:pimeloyl-ACP methyl ester carboxylesterase
MTDQAPYRSIWTHLMRTPFTQGFVKVNGIDTRYVQAGPRDAPALVMLHGTAGSWECFAANLEAHAQHFNCLAIDMVGSGFTDKPDVDYEIRVYVDHVVSFMARMGVAKASFIGVSLGAWVATRLAVARPDLVEKLILLAPSGMVVNAQTMGDIKSRRTAAVDNPSWDAIKAIFANLIYDEANRIPDLVAVRQAVYRLPEMKQAMLHVLCLQDPAIRTRNLIADAEWASIAAPTLLIAAPDDNPDYLKTAYRAEELIPDARIAEMRQVKHWGQFEAPETFNRISLDFLTAG